jgi:dipeptidyl aminopeptidase/acylaminoacyl peptidase
MIKRILCATSAAFLLIVAPGFSEDTYKKPPQAVLDVLNAPLPPDAVVSPSKDFVILTVPQRYPPIADVAAPMLRLAGERINPATNGPHRAQYVVSITLKKIADGAEMKIALPPNAKPGRPQWNTDGKQFAFTNTTSNGIELWIGDAATAKIHKVPAVAINAAYGDPLSWTGNHTILIHLVPSGRGKPPAEPAVPLGPNVQETSGNTGPVRTYEDMLQTPHDENLWDYYATSQLAFVDSNTDKVMLVGKPAIFANADVSADGKFLIVSTLHRPYSYLHPASQFPRLIEIWDSSGKVIHRVADLPLADRVPIGGVRTGPRLIQWQPLEPSTLVWVEALDDGNPAKRVPSRDRIMTLKAPFASSAAVELFKTEQRTSRIGWIEKDRLALITETDRQKKRTRTFLVNLDNTASVKELWSRDTQDRYRDPGTPVTRVTDAGNRVIVQNGDWIFLQGEGASPQGDLPFFDRFNLRSAQSERIFRSSMGSYEVLAALLNDDGSQFLTRRETPSEPPNYFVRQRSGSVQAFTKFADPAPILRKVKKQLVTYKRADGVQLSFTLYLPPDYKEGTRLPTLIWAYPYEYNDEETASQVSGSPSRFTSLSGASELFFALQGYAVLDNAAMPVVGALSVVNDTYVKQIVMDAKAAIDKAAEMGVTDPKRVGVAGHSYGAFMTANLLAHSDLFRAGIARSGAYNRTLTPFGFQSEERTLWEAPDTYLQMSPFMFADKIKTPILLIHGEADDNSGTFPIQSERLYQALRGNGATARLVMLPAEAHGYQAKETIEHVLYEMLSWGERYLKDIQ